MVQQERKGIEICEGDILKFENGKIRTVFRVKGGFAVESLDCDVGKYDESFCCPIEGLSYEQTAGYIESHAKVIDDIYRNPELLD